MRKVRQIELWEKKAFNGREQYGNTAEMVVIMGIRAIHRAISSIHSLSRSLALKQQGQSVSSCAFHEYIHSISLNLSFKTSALLSYLPVLQRKTQQNANYSLSHTFDTALSIRRIPRPQTRHVCVLINSPK
jgi:hypothetical protein